MSRQIRSCALQGADDVCGGLVLFAGDLIGHLLSLVAAMVVDRPPTRCQAPAHEHTFALGGNGNHPQTKGIPT
jgi:hypothetical protein